jgi:serine phosphatase RsbU (regulator of sigma subunit)/Tfp pilus assembly protein PilF
MRPGIPKIFMLVLLLTLHLQLRAQNNERESLLAQLKACKQDSAALTILNRIGATGSSGGFTVPERKLYLNQAISISKKLHDEFGLGNSLALMGNVYRTSDQKDSALADYQKALEIFTKLKKDAEISSALYSISQVEMTNGQYKEALAHLQSSMKYAERTGDKEHMSYTLGAMANLDVTLKNYTKAIEEHTQALKIAMEIKKNFPIAYNLNGLATCYSELKDYEKAISFYNQSLEVYREIGDEGRVAMANNNIGTVYAKQKKYADALVYFRKGLAGQVKLGRKAGELMGYANIGFLEMEEGKYKDAIEDFSKACDLAKESGRKDDLKTIDQGLAMAYAGIKQYDKAYEYQTQFSALSDSIYNEGMAKSVSEMQVKYDADRKQKEIALLKKDAEIQELTLHKNRFWMLGLIGAGIIVLLIMALVYRSYLQKKKSSEILTLQNHEISLQKKEITDSISYARRIQQSILPPEVIWNKLLPGSFVLYKPKDIVSGDFYWIESRENKILFSAVDCTGHGVPGALMSVVGFNFLTQAVSERGLTKPSDILEHLDYGVNKMLRQSYDHGSVKDGMDLALCTIDLSKRELQYAGAYNSLYYISEGKLHEVKADKKPIGSNIDEITDEYTNHEIQLKKGDCVYLFSDGYADQFGGPKGKKFKYKALQEVLLRIWEKNPEEQRLILDETIEQWKGKLEQVDDILILGVKL